jgi:hypothetical protein
MTDHLPECPMLDERYPKHPLEKCDYCEMLRACEQRVANKIAALLVEGIDWQDGFAAGLTAAREAVDGLDKYTHGQISAADALAAIDALREKP